MKVTVTGVGDRIDIRLDRFCPFNDGGRRPCGNWCVKFNDDVEDLRWDGDDLLVCICHNESVRATPINDVTAEYFRRVIE